MAGGGKFGIKINPELILKLTEPPPPSPDQSPPFFPAPPQRTLPKPRPKPNPKPKPKPEALPSEAALKPPEPSLPLPQPSPPPPADADPAVLLPFKKTLAECEAVLAALKATESEERASLQQRAKELSLHPPSPRPKPPPCPDEKRSCVGCLNANPNDPLKCQDSVRAYALCAQQQLLQRLAASSPRSNPVSQVNS